MEVQARKAERFLEMHSGEILVLPNAWDAASARIFAAAGARAVGTTSMGISASLGFPDLERIPLDLMLESVRRIAEAVDLPVSADMEAGYGDSTREIVTAITRAIECGAVGINLEDGTGDAERPLLDAALFADRIAAVREASTRLGLHLVINGRTDALMPTPQHSGTGVAEAIERCNRYRTAGADCVFVPGSLDRGTIRTLAKEIDAPLNVLSNPALSSVETPAVAELQALGVARVSVGSGIMRAALGFVGRAAEELLTSGSYDAMRTELLRDGAADTYRAAVGG